jgi:hypothetical protein
MRVFFNAPYPIFGKATAPLSIAFQQRSPYYWWWECLRRNEQYLACCANGGKGDLAALYADFGDVLNDSFKDWWSKDERGAKLFGEKHLEVAFRELKGANEWDSKWTADKVMVVSVPLESGKRQLMKLFGAMLKGLGDRHKGKRGRKKMSDSTASTAQYPLHRIVSIHTLRIQLAVYDAVVENKRSNGGKTLAQIGAKLKLVKTAMPISTDDKVTAYDKRNIMAATVSRHYKDAARIIANTAKGEFPNSK